MWVDTFCDSSFCVRDRARDLEERFRARITCFIWINSEGVHNIAVISDDIRMFVLNSFSPGSQTPVDISSDDIENKASPCDHFEMAMSEHE